jgi:hypothetical protein
VELDVGQLTFDIVVFLFTQTKEADLVTVRIDRFIWNLSSALSTSFSALDLQVIFSFEGLLELMLLMT